MNPNCEMNAKDEHISGCGPVDSDADCFDAFISYRRDSGSETAALVQEILASKYRKKVYLDVDELEGIFDEKLISVIKNTPNFIIILSKGALDRCVDEKDWVRREISTAIESGRNIIPIAMPGFTFPKDIVLPEVIRQLERYSWVEYKHVFRNNALEKVAHRMQGTSIVAPWVYFAGFFAVFAVMFLAGFAHAYYGHRSKAYLFEKAMTGMMLSGDRTIISYQFKDGEIVTHNTDTNQNAIINGENTLSFAGLGSGYEKFEPGDSLLPNMVMLGSGAFLGVSWTRIEKSGGGRNKIYLIAAYLVGSVCGYKAGYASADWICPPENSDEMHKLLMSNNFWMCVETAMYLKRVNDDPHSLIRFRPELIKADYHSSDL